MQLFRQRELCVYYKVGIGRWERNESETKRNIIDSWKEKERKIWRDAKWDDLIFIAMWIIKHLCIINKTWFN